MTQRYDIFNVSKNYAKIFSLLPLEGKDVWGMGKWYLKDRGLKLRDQVICDPYMDKVNVHLNNEEADLLRSNGIQLHISVKQQIGEVSEENKDFVGQIIPHYNQWVSEVKSANYLYDIPNPDTTQPPYRTEYYVNGGNSTQNRNYVKNTITGQITEPCLSYLGIPKAHAKDYKGAGVKVCVIDGGWVGDGSVGSHQDLVVEDSFGFTTEMNDHHCAMMSVIGAKDNGVGILGIAPECQLYAASYVTLADSFSWALQQGCLIFNCSFETNIIDQATRNVIEKIRKKGGIIGVSAGNSSVDAPTHLLASIKGTTIVGGTYGGVTNEFTDNLRYHNVQGNSLNPTKTTDFLVPSSWNCAVTNVPGDHEPPARMDDNCNWYQGIAGTSPSNAGYVGIAVLMKSKYPLLNGNVINTLMKLKSRKLNFSDQSGNNYSAYIPQNIF